jgi:hypothetical protein
MQYTRFEKLKEAIVFEQILANGVAAQDTLSTARYDFTCPGGVFCTENQQSSCRLAFDFGS